jgi:hypothetical protein
MIIPKYTTVYPKNGKATINPLYECVIWIKDKETKEHLSYTSPENALVDSYNEYLKDRKQFVLRGGEIYFADNVKSKRILIKYVPVKYYKIVDRYGYEMPEHYSGRPRMFLEAERMLNSLNNGGEFKPYKMIEI